MVEVRETGFAQLGVIWDHRAKRVKVGQLVQFGRVWVFRLLLVVRFTVVGLT